MWSNTIPKALSRRATPPPTPKTVLVIGGGPAGLEASRVAALRGHDVHLFEASGELGGQLRLASKPPGKDEIEPFREYLVHQVSSLPISVELNLRATIESVQNLSPDAVIIAMGATPVRPPSFEKASVPVLSAWEVFENGAAIGEQVVVAGGGATGCEVAEYLASKGKRVTVVEMEWELARDMNPLGEGMRHFLLERMQALRVNVVLGTKFLDVRGSEVVVADASGVHGNLPADTVVLSMGVAPKLDLNELALRKVVPEVYLIGDCLKPRNLLDAVWEGAFIAKAL